MTQIINRNNPKGYQKFVSPGEDYVLNNNLYIKLVIPLIFTDIQRKQIRLFNKTNGVSFMYRWFIYVTMEHWIVPRQGHFIFVIFINFTIGSVPISALRWPSLGKIVLGFIDILFVAYQTCRYTYTIICACQVLVEWEGFSFAHYLWNTRHHWFVVFSMVTTKGTVDASTWHTFGPSRLVQSKVVVVCKYLPNCSW